MHPSLTSRPLAFFSSGRRTTRNVPTPEAPPWTKGNQRRPPFSHRPSRFVDHARFALLLKYPFFDVIALGYYCFDLSSPITKS
jgi:hypothetical protein